MTTQQPVTAEETAAARALVLQFYRDWRHRHHPFAAANKVVDILARVLADDLLDGSPECDQAWALTRYAEAKRLREQIIDRAGLDKALTHPDMPPTRLESYWSSGKHS